MVQEWPCNQRRTQVSRYFLGSRFIGSSLVKIVILIFLCLSRYFFEKEGEMCKLYIKECRPDDECEYACGVNEKRIRARLFVEGKRIINIFSFVCDLFFLYV